MKQPPNGPTVRRRVLLGALTAGVVGSTSGCIRRVQSIAGWESKQQVTLEIKTLPTDEDPYALHVARTIADWYGAAGIDTQIVPMAEKELLRHVLLSHDFGVFVARGVDRFQTPDALFALLHSRYVDAAGWQNPFGFADLDVDAYLETQRRTTGPERREALAELQRSIARSQPFTIAAFPDDIRAARRTRFTNWRNANLRSPYGYLSLERVSDGGAPDLTDDEDPAGPRDDDVLRVVATDRRATENLNPLSVEYRRSGVLTGLLYDSLGHVVSSGVTKPWLADSWAFSTRNGNPVATVRLRTGLRWHDDEPLTADDVAFTYDLLADTTLSSADGDADEESEQGAQIPAPRFQGRSGLVADVRVLDDDAVEFEFVDCSPRVATRAFTVPILPKHVWADRSGPAQMGGIEIGPVTEALVTANIPPIGSGPLRFVRNTPQEELVLERFDEHFLAGNVAERPAGVDGPPAFDRLVVRVVGSDEPAIEMVTADEADLTGTPVAAATVPRIGRASDVELVVSRTSAPYIIGYNSRRPPLSNPRFRNTLAQIVDQSYLAEAVFGGYARPAVSPLAGTTWPPTDLRWDDGNPITPFLGTEGQLDGDRARDVFRSAGYQYDDGKLVRGT